MEERKLAKRKIPFKQLMEMSAHCVLGALPSPEDAAESDRLPVGDVDMGMKRHTAGQAAC